MADKILIKRGLKANLPTLGAGEMAFCTDTKELFVGSSTGNVLVNTGGVTNLDSLTDVDLASASPVDGDVLRFSSGSWKPSAVSSSSSSGAIYVIELSRWGITQGIPAKPWVTEHYNMANANIAGINNALKYAFDNGYNEVVLPRGEYAICYPNPITTQANMTINFNHSTLKVIYDSLNRSPFDTSSNPIYEFGGTCIQVKTPNTHIINLNLIGERADRAWTNVIGGVSEEQRLETTTGVFFMTGSNKSSIRYSKIGFFMADALATGFNGYASIKSLTDVEFGDIDNTGVPVTSTDAKRVRSSKYITLPSDTKIISLLGIGYAPATSIPSGRYDVVFYAADNSFLYKTSNARTRDPIIVPPNATQVKLTFVGDGTVDQGLLPNNPAYYALLVKDSISDGVIIEYNEIYGCHRGGLFLGSNNCLIRRNWFHDTGTMKSKDVYGLPPFTDFTCYSITSEDNFGHNCRIVENVIENTRMAIAMRGEFNEINNNEFKNCGYSMVLYNQEYLIFKGNTAYNAEFHNYSYTGVDRQWIISDNIFDGSSITFTGTGMIAAFTNNILKDGAYVTSTMDINNFRGNTITAASTVGGLGANTLVDSCTFTAGAKLIDASNINLVSDKVIRCKFIDSIIDMNLANMEITIRDSVLRNTYCQLRANGTKWILRNCKVDNTTGITPVGVINSTQYGGLGRTKEKLEIYNSDIKLGHVSLVQANEMWSVVIRDSKIIYTPTANLTQALVAANNPYGLIEITNSTIQSSNSYTVTQNADTVVDLIIKNSTLTNFSLTNNPTPIQSNLMDIEPVGGTYKLADIVQNKTPLPGGYMGWICTTPGVANNSSWAAKTNYRIWNKISYNGYVYQTDINTSYTVATSCKTIPILPTTVGQTVQDIVGTTTWSPNTTYAVGDAMLPTVPNGYWYECGTAGTSGVTEPVWPTAGNKADGTATWAARKIITWTNVGTKATFKPYGLIGS